MKQHDIKIVPMHMQYLPGICSGDPVRYGSFQVASFSYETDLGVYSDLCQALNGRLQRAAGNGPMST